MPVRRAVRLLAHKKRTLRERYYYYTIPVPGSQEAFGAKLAAEMRLQPAGKRNRLSHRLCPPGPPGRRSRAAQALVAPAGAKLPRTAIITAGLVFLARALPFCCRPSGRGFERLRVGEDGPMAGCRPTGQEAQTAAGPRGRRYLPKTARRAPQALEAGAFWDHRPKSLLVCTLPVLLQRVFAVFLCGGLVAFLRLVRN